MWLKPTTWPNLASDQIHDRAEMAYSERKKARENLRAVLGDHVFYGGAVYINLVMYRPSVVLDKT